MTCYPSLGWLSKSLSKLGITGGGGDASNFSLSGAYSITSGTSETVTISPFVTIYGTNIAITNTRYKLYNDAGLVNLVYTTPDLAANAEFTFTSAMVTAGTYYVYGEHKISRPSSYASEIPSLYLTRTGGQQVIVPSITDNVTISLTTNLAAYNAAGAGSWVAITDTEYAALVTNVTSTTRSGTEEANVLTGANGNFAGGSMYTFGHSNNPTPANAYIYAFKVAAVVPVNGAEDNLVRISNLSDGSGFNQLGSTLPTGQVFNSQQHFVLKGANTIFPSGYVGASLSTPNSGMYYQATGSTGRYDPGSTSNVTNGGWAWSMQVLSTPIIQWT
ncbi:MAG: hypothetical protein O3C19_04560 [Bacteroidetes bacterium]|nr:hypothetical protein [Bacteroidota bacterium]